MLISMLLELYDWAALQPLHNPLFALKSADKCLDLGG